MIKPSRGVLKDASKSTNTPVGDFSMLFDGISHKFRFHSLVPIVTVLLVQFLPYRSTTVLTNYGIDLLTF